MAGPAGGKMATISSKRPILCRHYHEAAVVSVRGVDYSGVAPIPCELPDGLKGATLGNDKTQLGWFRDAHCEPPEWPMKLMSWQSVTVDAPGDSWQAEFIDPETGMSTSDKRLETQTGQLRISLP